MQGDPEPVPQEFRQNQARKPGPGTQIRQALGAFWNQGDQLRGIPEVPPPQILERFGGDQIVTKVPVQEQFRVALEAGQCFT